MMMMIDGWMDGCQQVIETVLVLTNKLNAWIRSVHMLTYV